MLKNNKLKYVSHIFIFMIAFFICGNVDAATVLTCKYTGVKDADTTSVSSSYDEIFVTTVTFNDDGTATSSRQKGNKTQTAKVNLKYNGRLDEVYLQKKCPPRIFNQSCTFDGKLTHLVYKNTGKIDEGWGCSDNEYAVLTSTTPTTSSTSSSTIKNVRCNYDIKNNIGQLINKIDVTIYGYKNNNSANKFMVVRYQNSSGSWSRTDGVITDTKVDNGFYLRVQFTQQDFISKYAANGNSCPTIYAIDYGNSSYDMKLTKGTEVENSQVGTNNSTSGTVTMGESSTWTNRTSSTVTDSLNEEAPTYCPTSGYKTFQIDLFERQLSIKFETKKVGTTKYYTIKYKLDGDTQDSTHSVPASTFNTASASTFETIPLNLLGATFRINGDQLPLLFNQPCKSAFMYLDASLADMKIYYITTDEQEAEDNSVANRYYDDEGSTDTVLGDTDSLNGWGGFGDGTQTPQEFCSSLFGTAGSRNTVGEIIETLMTLIRIGAPIILVLTSMIDFTKATGNDEKIPQAKKNAITRGIIAVVILFVPSLISLVLSLVGWDSCDIF